MGKEGNNGSAECVRAGEGGGSLRTGGTWGKCGRTSGDAKVMDGREAPLLRVSEEDFKRRLLGDWGG